MSAHKTVIPDLDNKGLRQFAITTGIVVTVLFGLFFPWLFERSLPLWPWIFLGFMTLWGLVAPASLKPVYRGWMRFGLLISKVTTPIIFGIVYYLVIVPFGLVRRVVAKDPLRRTIDKDASTYRVESERPEPDNLEHPY